MREPRSSDRASAALAVAILAAALSSTAAQAQPTATQDLRETRPALRREVRMQVGFTIPTAPVGTADATATARQQAESRKAMYGIAFRECEAIVETVADECRLDAFTMNASPVFNPMVQTQLTATATYAVVPKR